MAQTWRVTKRKVSALKLIDAIGGVFSRARAGTPLTPDTVRSVLVLEPWHIGDVVLATSVLRVLRDKFPAARITVLGKEHAAELLQGSDLVDEMVVVDLPWTAKNSKYDPRRYDWNAMRDLVADLRRREFDVTIDARMDLRSNLLTFMTKSPRRIGFDFGGGSFLLTDAVPADPDKAHRVDDWLSLILPLVGDEIQRDPESGSDVRYAPRLVVSAEESLHARALLNEAGIGDDDVVVAFHGGASDPRRMWPAEHFERVARTLVERHGVKCVFLVEPGAEVRDIPVASAVLKTTLRQMMAVLSQCDMLICNDSGPMHIADALGIAVVAVFLTGNPVWHRPYRPGQSVVGKGTGHEFLEAPTEAGVIAAAESQLERIA